MLAAGALLAASALAAETVEFKPGDSRAKVEAVVIPDFVGEHLVMPVTGKLNIPGDNLALILLESNGGYATVVWRDPALKVTVDPSGVTLEGDSPAAKVSRSEISIDGVPMWYRVAEKLNDQNWQPVDWRMPFVADFYVNYKKTVGALPPENGRQESWKIMPLRTGKNFNMLVDTSLSIYNCDTWSNWVSGYGSTIYPARADKGHVYLRFLLAEKHPNQKHDAEFGGYVFPMAKPANPDYWTPIGLCSMEDFGKQHKVNVEMPRDFIVANLAPEQWRGISEIKNEGKWFPATCGVTEAVEKIFYHSKSYEQRADVAKRIGNMDKFVQRIRDRIEEFRKWGADESAWLKANAPANIYQAFADDFAEYEKYYQQFRDRMKTPEDCRKLSARVVALADDPKMDDEDKEEACKELGRTIRTIGGCQDNMAAEFRRIAKCIRQKATEMYAAAGTGAERAALSHIRATAIEHLHNRMPHEGK